ncbi:MAG: hypothetical protein JST19_22160 [Bacteroidetes bacterium]|nr:hypothetical protein [Bacteroidota bacterium]
MKKRSKILVAILLFYIIAGTISCVRQQRTKEMQSIVNDILSKATDKDAKELYKKIVKYGKQAIPYLIEKIDAKGYSYVGKLDPMNSNIMSLYNYNGMQAAYVTELILSGANYNGQRAFGDGNTMLFSRNIILKEPNHEALKYTDMIKVKSLYENWWQHHRNKQIKDLIIAWNHGDRPLFHSVYEWY